MKVRVFLLLAAMMLCTNVGHAQTVTINDQVILNFSGVLKPVGGATVTLCAFGASGLPCTPALLTATADINGNFSYAFAPGKYTETQTAVGVTGRAITRTIFCDPTQACVMTGAVTCKSFQSVLCVDNANSAGWSGSDLGAWINSAYGALAATGGRIIVATNAPVSFSTPILFTGNKKPALLECVTGSQTVTFTPTSGIMITLDWSQAVPSAGPSSIASGVQGCNFVGSGGTSIAIQFSGAPGNGGVSGALVAHNEFSGFGTNLNFPSGDQTLLTNIEQNYVGFATTGVNYAGHTENLRFRLNSFSGNATGFNVASTAAAESITLDENSFDTNTVAAIVTNTPASLFMLMLNNHFEDNAGGSTSFITLNGGYLQQAGDNFIVDATTGSATAPITVTAGNVSSWHVTMGTGGKTFTAMYNMSAGSHLGTIAPAHDGHFGGPETGSGDWWNQALATNDSSFPLMMFWSHAGTGQFCLNETGTVCATAFATENTGNPGNIFLSETAPTISTHFNTSADSIVSNGTISFTITVGTGAGTTTGALALPTAATGWNCWLTNQTRAAQIQQTGSSATSATFTNYSTTFSATNWTNSDVLRGGCAGY